VRAIGIRIQRIESSTVKPIDTYSLVVEVCRADGAIEPRLQVIVEIPERTRVQDTTGIRRNIVLLDGGPPKASAAMC